MKITAVKAYAVTIPRDLGAATGTAGSPVRLVGPSSAGTLRWAKTYPLVYSTAIETLVVRLDTDAGLVGWGEAQSPVAPAITRTIVESLVAPLAIGEDPQAPALLWERLYSAMRVRGHTGSFLLDALAAIDIAAWDICGKASGQPVSRLLGGPAGGTVRSYVSGLAGASHEERVAYARRFVDEGARALKIFLDASESHCLTLLDRLRGALPDEVELFVDALWRLTPKRAIRFARALESRGVGWLEAPLVPEDVRGHREVASRSPLPIALGESYRSRFELMPFFEARALDLVQPDIGRTGITEGCRILAIASGFHVPAAIHISIGLGPQIAAALHVAAATPGVQLVECNPVVYDVANRFLKTPVSYSPACLTVPAGPGLGIHVDEEALARAARAPVEGADRG